MYFKVISTKNEKIKEKKKELQSQLKLIIRICK